MSDRTSARLFGRIFDFLAGDEQHPPDAHAKGFAVDVWRIKDEMGCDFGDSQMDADDALVTLGLAVKVTDPDYPADGEITLYVGDDGGPELPPPPKPKRGW